MSTPLYDALVAKVRDWANRDSTVLSDSIVNDALDYAADTCYRELRIPPLEYTYRYPTITTAGDSSVQLPPDVTEFIMFSRTDVNGSTLVFDQKLDLQSFTDMHTSKGHGSFTRKGQNIHFYPASAVGEVYEIHYYRRLFDLDAAYVVNQNNIDVGNTTVSSVGLTGAFEYPVGSGAYYTGNEVYNWLRDDNERMLLWGALHYAFDYMGDEASSAKYLDKQMSAIGELNREEKRRRVTGASNSVTYEVSGLL